MTESAPAWVTDTSSDLDEWVKAVIDSALAAGSRKIEFRPKQPISGAGERRDIIDETFFPILVSIFRRHIGLEPTYDAEEHWNNHFHVRRKDSEQEYPVDVLYHPSANGPLIRLNLWF